MGEEVIADSVAFEALLPLIVENRQGRQWMFGFGLATGAISPLEVWASLVDAFQSTPDNFRNVQVLRGFLSGIFKRDVEIFEFLLDQASEHPALASWLPVLQVGEKINARGCKRLLRSMADPNISAEIYSYLGYGRVTSALNDKDMGDLMRQLSRMPKGAEVAIDVLSMHIHDESKQVSSELTVLGRELIAQISISGGAQRLDFAVKGLVQKFLPGKEGESCARLLLRKIKKEMNAMRLSPYEMQETLKALFSVQPAIALDELVGDENNKSHVRTRAMLNEDLRPPLSTVPSETLIAWCAAGNPIRWHNVAVAIPFISANSPDSTIRWSAQAISLLRSAPEPIKVAKAFVDRIEPSGWSGSRAEAIEARLPLLDKLSAYLSPEDMSSVSLWKLQLQQGIVHERHHELTQRRNRSEGFE